MLEWKLRRRDFLRACLVGAGALVLGACAKQDEQPGPGKPGATAAPRPTATPKPTPTITPRPAGIDARKAYDQALAKAKEWGGEVVLLQVADKYDSGRKAGGVDLKGGGLAWVFDFVRKDAQGTAQTEWYQVTVGPQGVLSFKPYTSNVKSGDYTLIASAGDWKVTSAQALQLTEAEGGKAYREALKQPAGISAQLTCACKGPCPNSPKGLEWEIRYEGGAQPKVFKIDANTGKVVSSQ
jgi:hypothetical protein